VWRRRDREGAGRAGRGAGGTGPPGEWPGAAAAAGRAAGPAARPAGGGPWDAADDYPPAERVDCGSLLIPVRDEFDVQINLSEEEGAWVAVVQGDSGLQLQAFAAPKSTGLWEEVRREIAENLAGSGGRCAEIAGRFGPELRGTIPLAGQEPAATAPGRDGRTAPVRFLGADGPRWFLRGVLSGPAAADDRLAAGFEEVFADVVVVRGDYPAPPREPLEVRLPEEAQRALDEQLAEQGLAGPSGSGWELRNPFERGPEITETR